MVVCDCRLSDGQQCFGKAMIFVFSFLIFSYSILSLRNAL